MAKYRKRPVLVDAIQWDGSNIKEIIDFFDNNQINYDPENNEIRIWTLEGLMRADIGSYIIKGVKGEVYACREDIFKETYIVE